MESIMSKYRYHPVVRKIVDGLTDLNLPQVSWSKDVPVASLTGECQAFGKTWEEG
jgi:hypothetical protein